MAESYANPPDAALAEQQRRVRIWVFSLLGGAVLMAVLGLALAAFVPGVAKPYAGLAYVMAIGLALVVGASKTSSA